jgi:hypothetical protein
MQTTGTTPRRQVTRVNTGAFARTWPLALLLGLVVVATLALGGPSGDGSAPAPQPTPAPSTCVAAGTAAPCS